MHNTHMSNGEAMSHVIEVRVALAWEHYYGAVVFVDGVQTSFDCNHNHKTTAAAEKCVKRLEERAGQIVSNPTFTEHEVGVTAWGDERLVEWRWTEAAEGSETLRWMRVSYKDAGQGR